MPKNTSFLLGDPFDNFVSSQVAAGRYRNAGDVIRAGLRLLERETRLRALRQALIDGEQSGVAGPLDMEQIKRHAREAAGPAALGSRRQVAGTGWLAVAGGRPAGPW